MRLLLGLATCLIMSAHAAYAFERITTEDTFVAVVQGKALTRFGISLTVLEDGRIAGRALGRTVTGSWAWMDGFFCREMRWGARVFELNCQQVLLRGHVVRFIADRGAGDRADLTLK